MTKFKLVIEAEIELTEEGNAAWANFTDADKAEYFATVLEGVKDTVVYAIDEDGQRLAFIDVSYTEVSE